MNFCTSVSRQRNWRGAGRRAFASAILIIGAAVTSTARSATENFSTAESVQPNLQEIIFIDLAVPDVATLVAAVRPGIAIVLLDPREDELRQITRALAQRTALTAVHLVSHGAPGVLKLGLQRIDADFLEHEADELRSWRTALAPKSRLLLYGCDIAEGEAGAKFISELAAKTSSDVVASTNRTGATALGGDWELEARPNLGDVRSAFSGRKLDHYAGVLAATITNTNNGTSLVNQLTTSAAAVSNIAGISVVGNATQVGLVTNTNLGTLNGTAVSLSTGGIILTSGNTAGTGDALNSSGDADVSYALTHTTGFSSAATYDASSLSFTFEVTPGMNAVSLELVYATNEGIGDTQYLDAAVVMVDGVNYATFPSGLLLSNYNGDFLFGNGTIVSGFSNVSPRQRITALLNSGLTTHTIKIAIADNNDNVVDSAVIVAGFNATFTSGSGGITDDTNIVPTFVGATTTLSVAQNASATDIKGLLHVSDSDSAQTLTWTQSSAPSHGALSFSSATASSGGTDVAPGGTITYTPTSGYVGADSFTVQVSDGTATATRTITVTVAAPTTTVTSVTGPTGGSYKAGQTLSFTANFSAAVTVTGTPRLALTIGSSTNYAAYASGSGTTALVFSYTVQAGDTDSDGIAVASPIGLNGGTINDAYANPATLTFTAPSTTTVLVDTTSPVITSASSATAAYNTAFAGYTIAATDAAALTFSASNLPPGLSVSSSTGAITGTPTATNSYTATITATDVAGNSASSSLAFTVTPLAAIISWTTPAAITYGTPLSSTQLNATANVSGTFSYAPASGSIPVVGSQTLGVTFTPSDSTNYSIATGSTTISVNAAPLTVSGVTTPDKTYDGTTAATLAISGAALVGVVSGDSVSLDTTSATATFGTKAAGASKSVTVAHLALSGVSAGNYTLAQPTGVIGTILPKALTVTGITASDKTYDSSSSVMLNTGGAALVGVISGDAVTIVTSGATGAFADATVGTGKTVTISGLTLSGADAGNYTLTQPTTTASITQSTGVVTLGGLSATYDGSPHAATAVTTPTGLTVNFTYDGGSTPPINAGSYAVIATVNDGSYSGTATGTLTIAKAAQSITFSAIPATNVGSSIALSASASSGLTISFTVIEGDATISGSTLTINSGDSPVVVRASQAGNNNFVAAVSVDQTVGSNKLAQTITFTAPADKKTTDADFTLTASASSGLAVTFTIVSGPAILAGNSVTLTGVAGTVNVRASQAGNGVYAAAVDVDRSFNVGAVGPQVYFGHTTKNDRIAASLLRDGSAGTMIGYLAASNEGFVFDFKPDANGNFSGTATTYSGNVSGTTDATRKAAVTADTITAASTSNATRTFTGVVHEGVITGTISELGLSFTATVDQPTGSTKDIAGYYVAHSTQTISGETYAIVGTQGEAYVLAVTAEAVVAGGSAVSGQGSFAVASGNITLTGTVNASDTTVTGAIHYANGTTETFAGAASTTSRTDRLINLSSRGMLSPGASDHLITGFVIGGALPKPVLLRAIGPGLGRFGVTNPLPDPKLQLYNAARQVILENDDWSGADIAAAMLRVGAFALTSESKDAAVLTTLSPGVYTMHVTNGGGSGVALAEIYDASANPQSEYQRLINISSLGNVSANEGVLVGGFVITGNVPKRVLVRGAGPALTASGVNGVLGDPVLKLYDHSGVVVAQNDNWETPLVVQSSQTAATGAEIAALATETGAFAFAAGSKDAAMIVTLAPGLYSAQITGGGGATGVAMIEVYEAPE